jgi:fumarate reductase subunit D
VGTETVTARTSVADAAAVVVIVAVVNSAVTALVAAVVVALAAAPPLETVDHALRSRKFLTIQSAVCILPSSVLFAASLICFLILNFPFL